MRAVTCYYTPYFTIPSNVYHNWLHKANMSCIFCGIASGEIACELLYQDDKMVAFKDLHPQAPVHVLLLPRKHIPHLQSLEEEDAALMGHLIAKSATIAAQLGLEVEGYRLVNNCKEKAGQSVWHVHFHLLGGRAFAWPPG